MNRLVNRLLDISIDYGAFLVWSLLGFIVAAMLFLAIAEALPIQGRIEGKTFLPAHEETYYTTHCIAVPTKEVTLQNCYTIPHTRFVQDIWLLQVCNSYRCKQLGVSQAVYSDNSIGADYTER